MRVVYISVDSKDYTVNIDAAGTVQSIQVGSYSYKGRLVLRSLKPHSAVWRRVVKALEQAKN